MSITAALSSHADRAPDRIALAFEQDRISWLGLDAMVHRLAADLAARMPEGSGIGLHLANGPALALLFLAAARAGREAQVLDPEWPVETTRAVLAQLSPALLVSAEKALSGTGSIVLEDPFIGFESVARAMGAAAARAPVVEPEPSLPFYVGFTSGSTGMPKGYRRDHHSWLESFRGDDMEFGLGPDDVILAPGTLTHSLFLYAFVRGLHAGATVVLSRRFNPNVVLKLIRRHGASVLYGVPAQLKLTMDAAELAGEGPFESLRWIFSSGAKWPAEAGPRLERHFPMARFCEFYGSSELSYVAVAKDREGVPPGSVGRAFPGVRITIRDPSGRALPAGRPGLVFVESPLRFMGYVCGGEDSVPMVENAVSAGDIGFLDDDGFLHLVGRENRMIVSSGKNVHPEEIEGALRIHPAIAAAGVLGLADARRGERLVALLRCRDDCPIDRAGIIAHARARLPLYKVPRLYGSVRHWPMTASGKTDFGALDRIWRAGEFQVIN